MARFTKQANNTIILSSNGSINDGLKISKWARELINSCDAKATNSEQAFILSAAHRTDYSPNEISLSFSKYYFTDIGTWLKMCKNR
jgi:hypothetical protein